MASIFEQTIVPKINFSNFDLSEWQLISCNFGQLIPCYLREVLPNDVYSLGANAQVNFAPMVAPMYQNVKASIHFFYVPNRIIWDNFETFITGSEDGHVVSDDKLPVQPGLTLAELADFFSEEFPVQGSLLDYFGLPNTLSSVPDSSIEDLIISDLPLRAYFKCWYDYYRDENLQHSFLADPEDPSTEIEYFDFWREWRSISDPYLESSIGAFGVGIRNFQPFYRSYRKDYFTAALQTAQKGEPVTLSLGGTVPVSIPKQDISIVGNTEEANNPLLFQMLSELPNGVQDAYMLKGSEEYSSVTKAGLVNSDGSNTAIGLTGKTDNVLTGSLNLSQATAITVEALREAFAVQEILESLSMRGSRFTEFLKGNFGVTPDDYRLQRPQFLGGLVTPVQVQQVIQQSGYSGSDSRDMTGYAAGRAFAGVGGRVFRQRFKEHGWIIGIMSVMPDAYYYQGIPRHFMRRDRFDYYMPQTAHLGEQAIENIELYYDADSDDNQKVFGYIPRWAEYKTAQNGIHGDFRGNLNYYHMARIFEECPTLSEEFITTENVQTRPWAVWESEQPNINHLIWCEIFFRVTASRPMPYHSIPKVL